MGFPKAKGKACRQHTQLGPSTRGEHPLPLVSSVAIKHARFALAAVAQLEPSPIHQKVAGSIPSQVMWGGNGLDPYFSHTLMS